MAPWQRRRSHPLDSRLIDLACWLDRHIPLLRPLWHHLWRLACFLALRRLDPP
jgi:hypothetical protein